MVEYDCQKVYQGNTADRGCYAVRYDAPTPLNKLKAQFICGDKL